MGEINGAIWLPLGSEHSSKAFQQAIRLMQTSQVVGCFQKQTDGAIYKLIK